VSCHVFFRFRERASCALLPPCFWHRGNLDRDVVAFAVPAFLFVGHVTHRRREVAGVRCCLLESGRHLKGELELRLLEHLGWRLVAGRHSGRCKGKEREFQKRLHRSNENKPSRAAENGRKEQEEQSNYDKMWSKLRAASASATG